MLAQLGLLGLQWSVPPHPESLHTSLLGSTRSPWWVQTSFGHGGCGAAEPGSPEVDSGEGQILGEGVAAGEQRCHPH